MAIKTVWLADQRRVGFHHPVSIVERNLEHVHGANRLAIIVKIVQHPSDSQCQVLGVDNITRGNVDNITRGNVDNITR
ncbi:hypothetical protein Ddye_026746 [Dipteronia dyeriana]|uniref:Uncharacterized protein n=1 Tax=Dipteronia dyeriana TaxID=168575 RepID=A0AAD9TMY4_9ROSI|nr:hypothetical protein Ddye_026746 [Dipteronia dyeriana]